MEIIVPVAPEGGKAAPVTKRVAGLQGKVVGLLDNDWSSYGTFLDGIESGLAAHAVKESRRMPNLPRRGLLPAATLDALAAQLVLQPL